MTHRERIETYKDIIHKLYEKEGRSKSYIAKLLNVDRKVLTQAIQDWEFIQGETKYLPPAKQKFLNKHRKLIIDMLSSDRSIKSIAEKLEISERVLVTTYIKSDKELWHHLSMYKQRIHDRHVQLVEKQTNNSSRQYMDEDIPGEVWKEILGYPNYEVSNKGRVRGYAKRYKKYYILRINYNTLTGRHYVNLRNEQGVRNLSVARLVGFAHVPGYSAVCNTIDHKDNDSGNNNADNLEWVSQSENNKRAYSRGRVKNVAFSKLNKFKKIILDGKYEFKTVVALSKFLGVSVTQTYRYIQGETSSTHTFSIIY